MERHSPLVACETLYEHVGAPDWVVFDCRYRLGDPEWGPKEYGKGHIQGARHVHIDRELSSPVGTGGKGRHPLPIPGAFQRLLGTYGVGPETQIVCYDDEGGNWASRMWWLCRHYGLRHVAVLDGGLTRWKELGLPLTTSHEARALASDLDVAPGSMPTIDADGILARLGEKPVVDVRAPERYSGEKEPVDKVAGHIPTAVNVPFQRFVDTDKRFLSPDELRALLEPYGEDLAMYCGSGVTAATGVLAAEIAGLPTPALYPGSWSEWIRPAADRPIAIGLEPGPAPEKAAA